MAFAGERLDDHHHGALFKVEIEGLEVGEFLECKLPDIEVKVIEYNHGGRKSPRKRPGRVTYTNMVLKKGYSVHRVFQEWWENIAKGTEDRRSMSVLYVDEEDKEIMRWNLFECWPTKWKMSQMKGASDEISMEEIEVAVEFMERAG